MTLTDSDIRRIAVAVAAELRSGRPSAPGIGVRAHHEGHEQWHDEKSKTESMDPTSTGTDGESSSYEQTAARMWSRLRAKPKPPVSLRPRASKPKAAR